MLSSFFGGEKFPYCSKNVDITGIDVDSEAIELANKKEFPVDSRIILNLLKEMLLI